MEREGKRGCRGRGGVTSYRGKLKSYREKIRGRRRRIRWKVNYYYSISIMKDYDSLLKALNFQLKNLSPSLSPHTKFTLLRL